MATRPSWATSLMAPVLRAVCSSRACKSCTMLSTPSVELPSFLAKHKPRVALRQAQHHCLLIVALRLLAQQLLLQLRVSLHYCRRTFSEQSNA